MVALQLAAPALPRVVGIEPQVAVRKPFRLHVVSGSGIPSGSTPPLLHIIALSLSIRCCLFELM